jgi:glutamate---cysteine ligase / carboxylate-amine ligase
VGDAQRLSSEEQLRLAREQFEDARDFTVAVEEEFAILDPHTLEMVGRFEELFAAAQGTELEGHLVGELISSEVEIRTGRCESFAEAAATMAERRRQLVELAGRLGASLGSTGTHPWSPWQEQSIIDTPHYRRVVEGLRYVAWRNNTFGIHVHVGIQGADRAIAVCDALRSYLPELLALSASSPFSEGRYTHLHSTRTQIFTRMFPRCGIPDAYGAWEEYDRYVRLLYDTESIAEHTQIWWSVRPHLAFPTVELRICDGQPELGAAQALAAFVYSLVARVARALDEGERLPLHPNRLIEENLWRAIRYGLEGEMIDLDTGRVRPTRERLAELAEWVQPVADELGAASFLAVPGENAAQRQIARYERGATLGEIYADEIVEAIHV